MNQAQLVGRLRSNYNGIQIKKNETLENLFGRLERARDNLSLAGVVLSTAEIMDRLLVAVSVDEQGGETPFSNFHTYGHVENIMEAKGQLRSIETRHREVEKLKYHGHANAARTANSNRRAKTSEKGKGKTRSAPYEKGGKKKNQTGRKNNDLKCTFCSKNGHEAATCWKDPNNASKRPEWFKIVPEEEQSANAANAVNIAEEEVAYGMACVTINDTSVEPINMEQNYYISDSKIIIDSGCTKHMVCNEAFLVPKSDGKFRYNSTKITIASGETIIGNKIGDMLLMHNVSKEIVRIEDVLFVPGLHMNLLSTNQFTKKGYRVIIEKGGCVVQDTHRQCAQLKAQLSHDNLLTLNYKPLIKKQNNKLINHYLDERSDMACSSSSNEKYKYIYD